jgi:hypothetical protein
MTWREQIDGTYISDSAPYVATPIGGGDYSLTCLDPKEDKRFLKYSEILQAPFFPIPNSPMVLDNGTVFSIKLLSGQILAGATSANVAHGIPSLITGAKYIAHLPINNINIGSNAQFVFEPGANTVQLVQFNDTNMNFSRTGTTGNADITCLLFYRV